MFNPQMFMQQMAQFKGLGSNPQMMMNNLLQRNPQMRALMNQIQTSGMTPQQFLQQYAKQNNIDLNQLRQCCNQLGIKF